MARPIKTGIDYFPLDIDFLNDIKIRKVVRSVVTEAIGVIISILSNIYRDNGYFIHVDDDFYFLIAEEVNTTELIVEKVVNKLVDVDFFEANMFENHQILTSAGIQKRYVKACEKRKIVELDNEYLLTNFDNTNVKVVNNSINYSKSRINEVNSVNNSINDVRSTQSKVKESKGKESKVNYTESSQSQLQSVLHFYQNNFGVLSNYIQSDLMQWCSDLSPELSIKAMQIAQENQKSYNYAKGIMQNWLTKGIKTLDDVVAEQKAYQKNKVPYGRKHKKDEIKPYWAKETEETEQTEQPVVDDSGDDLLSEFRSLMDEFKEESDD